MGKGNKKNKKTKNKAKSGPKPQEDSGVNNVESKPQEGNKTEADQPKGSSSQDTEAARQKDSKCTPKPEVTSSNGVKMVTPEDDQESENNETYHSCEDLADGDFILVKGSSLPKLLSEGDNALEVLQNVMDTFRMSINNGNVIENKAENQEKVPHGQKPKVKEDTKKETQEIPENNLLKKQLDELNAEVGGLKETLHSKEKQLEDALKSVEELKQLRGEEVQRLKQQLKEREGQIKQIKDGELKRLNSDQQKAEGTIADLRSALEKSNKEITQSKRREEELNTKMAKLENSNQRARKEYEKKEGELKRQMECLKSDYSKEKENLQKSIHQLKEENEQLTTSLSRVMNSMMSRDESRVENISIKARPLKLVEDFEAFCTEEWLAAKTELDESTDSLFLMQENTKVSLLLDILMEAQNITSKRAKEHVIATKKLLDNPLSLNCEQQPPSVQVYSRNDGSNDPTNNNILPMELENEINKYLKIHSDNLECDSMAKSVFEESLSSIPESERDSSIRSSEALLTYSKSACVLAWKLSIQKPPMYFTAKEDLGQEYDPEKHDLQFGSMDPKTEGAKIVQIVQPGLWHGKKLMKKGRVYLGK